MVAAPSLHLFNGMCGPFAGDALSLLSSNSVTWSFPHSVRVADGFWSRSSLRCYRHRFHADFVARKACSGSRATVRDTGEDHTPADDIPDTADNRQVYFRERFCD